MQQHPVKISIVRTLDEPVKSAGNSSDPSIVKKENEHYRKKSREFSREDSLEGTLDTPVPRHASLDACNSNILRVGEASGGPNLHETTVYIRHFGDFVVC